MQIREQTLLTRFDFKDLPRDCSVCNVSVSWDGEPILLCEEGKPPRPSRDAGIEAVVSYLNSPPRAHHILHWVNGSPSSLRFDNPGFVTTNHAQPFAEGWLLGEARGGAARIFDNSGTMLRALNLGDAIEDIQTTRDGHIWVGYFDEGVFGNGIGQAGTICFDSEGNALFRYNELASKQALPDISDCYTMNVEENVVWLCYYTDFPLVCLKTFEVSRLWSKFGATRAVAVRGQSFIRFPAYDDPYLRLLDCDSGNEIQLQLIAPDGTNLSQLRHTSTGSEYVAFQVRARGSRMYIYDEHGLYELP